MLLLMPWGFWVEVRRDWQTQPQPVVPSAADRDYNTPYERENCRCACCDAVDVGCQVAANMELLSVSNRELLGDEPKMLVMLLAAASLQ